MATIARVEGSRDSYSGEKHRVKHNSHTTWPRIADVTLAYLKGKSAESEEARERTNSSSLALSTQAKNITSGAF